MSRKTSSRRTRTGTDQSFSERSHGLGVRLEPELYERLRFYAFKHRISMSDAVREILGKTLPKNLPNF